MPQVRVHTTSRPVLRTRRAAATIGVGGTPAKHQNPCLTTVRIDRIIDGQVRVSWTIPLIWPAWYGPSPRGWPDT